jgi:UDP-N-acetylmuramate: L-alanyl-gamma-D-glutamyl-meso-diaminopimelate ligase
LPPDVPAVEDIRHVHLVAVCGTAMGTLACMLVEAGFRVTGSDVAAYPPMSDQLQSFGITVQKGFTEEHVRSEIPDLVVIGNAVRRDNPEARAAIDDGLPYLSLPDAVDHFFLRGRHSVMVVGTHGKTTSTSLIAWVLTATGRDPSALIGGVASNFGASFRIGAGEHFVIEGDEYDTAFFDKTPKFLHYSPRTVLFTSCEFDHADIYDSVDDVERAFRELMRIIPADGHIVAATDVPRVQQIVTEEASAPVEAYGFQEEASWKVSDVVVDEGGTTLNVWQSGERLGRGRIPLHGRHNVENVLGALAICHHLGVDVEEGLEALAGFQGVKRRQEVRGEAAGMIVVEDFAHHPTEVSETVAALRTRYPRRRLWAIFEPRTNTSRRRYFENAYVEALAGADRVVVADVYRADQVPEEERMRPDRVVGELRAAGVEAHYLPSVDEIIDEVVHQNRGKDVALIMSNGDFGGIYEHLLTRLRRTGGD